MLTQPTTKTSSALIWSPRQASEAKAKRMEMDAMNNEWSGSPAPEAPDEWWVDDETGEYVSAETGERMTADAARLLIAAA